MDMDMDKDKDKGGRRRPDSSRAVLASGFVSFPAAVPPKTRVDMPAKCLHASASVCSNGLMTAVDHVSWGTLTAARPITHQDIGRSRVIQLSDRGEGGCSLDTGWDIMTIMINLVGT